MIPDQEMYLLSCQVSRVLVLSLFSTQLVNWNSLSPNLQYITNKHLFKNNVKAYLWDKILAVYQDDYIYFCLQSAIKLYSFIFLFILNVG